MLEEWAEDPTGGDLIDVGRVLEAVGYERRTSGAYSVYTRHNSPSWTFRATGSTLSGRVLQDFSETMLRFLETNYFL
jgi:hypothetical protein